MVVGGGIEGVVYFEKEERRGEVYVDTLYLV